MPGFIKDDDQGGNAYGLNHEGGIEHGPQLKVEAPGKDGNDEKKHLNAQEDFNPRYFICNGSSMTRFFNDSQIRLVGGDRRFRSTFDRSVRH